MGLSPFGFANNNPISFNDPMGDLTQAEFEDLLNTLWSNPFGGSWSSDNGGGGGGFGGGSSIALFGDKETADFFGGLAANDIPFSFGTDGNLRVKDMFVTSVFTGFKNGNYGMTLGGYYENVGNNGDGKINLDGVTMGSQFFKESLFGINNWFDGNNGAKSSEGILQKFGDGTGQMLNAGGVVWGGAEMGLQTIRHGNGAQVIGSYLGFETQQTARALTGTLGVVSKVGKVAGVLGYGISAVSIGSKLYNGEEVSTAEGVGFGVSTVFMGAGVVLAGTAVAPFVAAGALIYGAFELGSYFFTGNTAEENIFGK